MYSVQFHNRSPADGGNQKIIFSLGKYTKICLEYGISCSQHSFRERKKKTHDLSFRDAITIKANKGKKGL